MNQKHEWSGSIIDCHAHPRGLGDSSDLDRVFLDELIAYSRTHHVEKMVSLGEVLFKEHSYTADEIRWLNNRNAGLADAYPEFFIPFCFLDPVLGPEFVKEEIRRCFEEHGFRRLKLEICCNVNDPATDPVFEEATARGFPVLVHASDLSIIGYRDHQSDPEDVRAKAERFPEADIIMAHLTGIGVRGTLEVADIPNIAIDTSGMQPEEGIVAYAVSVLGADRILYGSDAMHRDQSAQVAQVLAADISDEDKKHIFYDNAVRWLKLDQRELKVMSRV